MTTTPTGKLVGADLQLARSFTAPIDDVWRALTDSARLARWIGYYTGDPASGSVELFMTAEADGEPPPSVVLIDECAAPRLLAVTQGEGDEPWRLRVELDESAGTTTLTFRHLGLRPEALELVGPGWEFYLDRLVAAETGGDVAAIDFDADYYPAMAEYYRSVGVGDAG